MIQVDQVLVKQGQGVVNLITDFVIACIEGQLKSASANHIGCFVYFLRQIYANFDGIGCVNYEKIICCLIKSLSRFDERWKILVTDNMLNFAGTPKGVRILHSSGIMNDCVLHMFHRYLCQLGIYTTRYRQKMQVSRCEKFGYGVLVSQIANTQPGMYALYQSGLFEFYLNDLWSVLEKDCPFGAPHLLKDEHATRKLINNLLKIIFSFEALWTIIDYEQRNRKLNDKTSFSFLFKQLVLLDVPERANLLVDYHDAHQVSLGQLFHSCFTDWTANFKESHLISGFVFTIAGYISFPRIADPSTRRLYSLARRPTRDDD